MNGGGCAGPVLDDVVAGEREHAAVGQLRSRSGTSGPTDMSGPRKYVPRRRIEDRRVREALIGGDVAADEQRAAVASWMWPAQKRFRLYGTAREGSGDRVPEPLRVQRGVEAVELEHLARRLERHVDGDERPG